MPRKVVGYILLSFLSFCFFTFIFNLIAIAQVSAQQSSPSIVQPELADPTPTIYNTQETIATQSTQVANHLTPTPTISKQQLNTAEQSNETTQPTETPVPPTATPTPTDVPTATPTPSPEPTITTATDLETLFSKYSSQYSISEDELKKIANCESGFNTNSDTGLYAGMFQFSASTWASVRGLMGLDPNPDLRKDPEQAIMTTAFMLSRGEQNAWPNCH
jgi:cytoskeletal protein RodZ